MTRAACLVSLHCGWSNYRWKNTGGLKVEEVWLIFLGYIFRGCCGIHLCTLKFWLSRKIWEEVCWSQKQQYSSLLLSGKLRIVELFRSGKTSKITEFNHKPSTTVFTSKPCSQMPHPQFWTPSGMVIPSLLISNIWPPSQWKDFFPTSNLNLHCAPCGHFPLSWQI